MSIVDREQPANASAGRGYRERKAWVKPAIEKMAASDAEVGTRAAVDGAFTTS